MAPKNRTAPRINYVPKIRTVPKTKTAPKSKFVPKTTSNTFQVLGNNGLHVISVFQEHRYFYACIKLQLELW
jgi:hypothetical protein